MADTEKSHQVDRYERFINDVLREELRQLASELTRVNAELSDLIQQEHTLNTLTDNKRHPEGFKTQVNIGCNFFMEARVKDVSKVLFNVGLNHYLELTLPEAKRHLNVRAKAMETHAEEIRRRSAYTKAHIKLMLLGVNELRSQQASK